jgi:hypothetical protein
MINSLDTWQVFAEGINMSDEACCNCDGNHVPKFPECPGQMDVTVARIRPNLQVSFVEAVKIAEGVSREEMVVDVPQSAVKP